MVTNNALNNSSSPFDVDNIHLETNTISTTDTNGNLVLTPNGTGDINVSTGDVNILGGAASIDPGAATDSYAQFNESTTGKWRVGNDATDDSFRISQGSALGTNDRFVMTSGGNRTLPSQCAFQANVTNTINNVTGNGTNYTIIYDTEVFDIGGDFNLGTSTFTAPVTGKYMLGVQCRMIGRTTANDYAITIITSNRNYIQRTGALATGDLSFGFSVLADMDASDTCTFQVNIAGNGSDNMDVEGGATVNFCYGYLAF